MTLYFSDEDDAREPDRDQIIENHPNYARFDDSDRLILNLDELRRDAKKKTLVQVTMQALEAADTYKVVQEPKIEWVGGE